MSRTRMTWLVLVLAALGLSLGYGLQGSGTTPSPEPDPSAVLQGLVDSAGLRAKAALEPCPTGLGLEFTFVLPCLGGGPEVDLSAPGTGVPTLVNIYGSWCGPCQDEMPLLRAFRERAGTRVRLVGIDTQDDTTRALNFAIDFQQHWPAVVDDDGKVFRKYGGGLPLTLLLDGTGRVAFVQRGAFRSAEQLDALVLTHLGVRV